MNPVEMKSLARKIFEKGWNEGSYDVLYDLNAPNCVLHDPNFPIEGTGPESVVKFAKAVRKAFPDINFKIEDQIAEGDKVVNYIHVTGTQDGEFLGVPPTHKKASIACFTLQRFENGKVVDIINLWDALGFMKNAGALEPLKEEAYAKR